MPGRQDRLDLLGQPAPLALPDPLEQLGQMGLLALSVATRRQEGWSKPNIRVSATPPVLLGRLPFSERAVSTV